MCRHYSWPHDFWRRMGTREFRAWVDQANRERAAKESDPHSWQDTEHDPGWQRMREKRDRKRGR